MYTMYTFVLFTTATRDTDRFGQPIPLNPNKGSENTVIDDIRERRRKRLKKQRKLTRIKKIVKKVKYKFPSIHSSVRPPDGASL